MAVIHFFLSAITATTSTTTSFWNSLNDLSLVEAVKELWKKIDAMADEIVTKVLKTQLLCLTDGTGETCMNRSQLNQLYSNADLQDNPDNPETNTTTNTQNNDTHHLTAFTGPDRLQRCPTLAGAYRYMAATSLS